MKDLFNILREYNKIVFKDIEIYKFNNDHYKYYDDSHNETCGCEYLVMLLKEKLLSEDLQSFKFLLEQKIIGDL